MIQKRIGISLGFVVVGLLLIGFGIAYIQIEEQISVPGEPPPQKETPSANILNESAVESEAVPIQKEPMQVTLTLLPQNNSKENGTAIVSEVSGKTEVIVQILNAPKNTPQPAHIHEGSCPIPGAVKYSLQNVIGGISTTTLDVPIDQLLGGLPLAINVHKSSAQAKVYVSCGNIIKEEIPPMSAPEDLKK